MSVALITGDCLEVMKEMESCSVNLIVTSPPYCEKRKSVYGGAPAHKYIEWFMPIASEIKRVLSPDGSFILNIKEHAEDGRKSLYVYKLITALVEELGWLWIDDYCWHKKNAYPGRWPNRFRDSWEHCYHLTRSKKFVMRQDSVMVPAAEQTVRRVKTLSALDRQRVTAKHGGNNLGMCRANWAGRALVYPSNVLHMAPEFHSTGHCAPFPEGLPEFFIKLLSDEGHMVMDPFSGSGTTCLVAARLKRNSIGIELLDEYNRLAYERIGREGFMVYA